MTRSLNANEINNGNNISKIQTFDEVLVHIGEMGRYQKFLTFMLLPFFCVSSMMIVAQFFITIVPEEHWCRIPEFENTNLTDWQKIDLSVPFESKEDFTSESVVTYSRCKMYVTNYTEVLMTGRRPDKNTPIDVCKHGWSFNQTSIPYLSMSAEMEWICDKSYLDNIVQSIFFAGCMTGALVFGYIADHYGRVPSVVLCNGIGFFGSIATAFCNSFWTFAIARFITGSALCNCLNIIFIIVMEYIAPKYRTVVSSLSFGIYYALGAIGFPWIAYWISDWKIISITSAFPFAIVFIIPLIVPESARWCIHKGQVTRALEILEKFAKVNKKNIDPELYEEFKKFIERSYKKTKSTNHTMLHLFKQHRLRRSFIVLVISWSLINLIYIGAIWNMQLLYSDVFTSYSVASICEVLAAGIVFFFLDKWGRRWMGFLSMFICGIFLFIVIVTPVGTSAMWAAVMARLGVTIAIDLNYQHATEILPTVVRAQGLSLIILVGAFMGIFGPTTLLLASIHPSLPFVLMGSLSFITAILILILPETTNQKLPESLKDGNDFGKEQRFWSFPCIKGSFEKKEKYGRNVIENMDSSLLSSTSAESNHRE